MKLDVLGLMAACSYALDCVEAELVHVTNNHANIVDYKSPFTSTHSIGVADCAEKLACCIFVLHIIRN